MFSDNIEIFILTIVFRNIQIPYVFDMQVQDVQQPASGDGAGPSREPEWTEDDSVEVLLYIIYIIHTYYIHTVYNVFNLYSGIYFSIYFTFK